MSDSTVRKNILEAMRRCNAPMAEQDFGFMGTNSSCVTRELRRMAKEGLVMGKRRFDPLNGVLKKYKEWELVRIPPQKVGTGEEKVVTEAPKQQELFEMK